MLTAEDREILFLTLGTAGVATLLLAVPGVALAWLLALPLVLPPTAVGLLLLELLGRGGALGRLLDRLGVEVLFTPRAVVLAMMVMAMPLYVRSARTAFEEIDPRLLAVARTLGRGPLAVFARVTLPLAWRGLLAGALLAFSRALGEFGATILVAGNIPGRTRTLALAIFHRSELGKDGDALRLVAVTTAVAFAAVWTTELVARRRGRRFAR